MAGLKYGPGQGYPGPDQVVKKSAFEPPIYMNPLSREIHDRDNRSQSYGDSLKLMSVPWFSQVKPPGS
jgi:hypothetical protein